MKNREIDYFFISPEKLDSFYIGKMEADNFVVPNPVFHRHNFHEIIWLKTGSGSHSIDGNCHDLAANSLSLIRKGQVHRFNELRNASGYYLRFTDDFLPDLQGQEAEIYGGLFSFASSGIFNPVLIPGAHRAEIEQLVDLIAGEFYRENSLGKKELVRHFLLALLIKIERLILLQGSMISPRYDAGEYQFFDSYLTLLEEHYRREHNVDFYAEKLQLSSKQLSNLLQQRTGKSAKRLIVERLLLEAKRLLSFTELPVKQIASSLGYNDPYHFSKLFKQETGLSPKTFREQ
ncbi:MAG: helix-turn-helix domain-containing protein [Chloroflexi bacterium]|nr:helix-turn-helix domain-containing protein [Chloroflexota bacterium]OJW02760.1 MAG: hypothetical protein BGO39_05910 [Chloroflexi bacterium 54-19]